MERGRNEGKGKKGVIDMKGGKRERDKKQEKWKEGKVT